MLKGESNGKVLQLTKVMMKGDSAPGASKLVVYGIATTAILHPNGVRGEDTARHGWGPVASDVKGTGRNVQKTNAFRYMQRVISNAQLDVRIGKGAKVPQMMLLVSGANHRATIHVTSRTCM
jgi:hypothetical protein